MPKFEVEKEVKAKYTAVIEADNWEDAEEIANFTTIDWQLEKAVDLITVGQIHEEEKEPSLTKEQINSLEKFISDISEGKP